MPIEAIMYHGTPWSAWEKIKTEGLIPSPLPQEIQESTGCKKGIYLGVDRALVDGFIEGYLFDMVPEETAFAVLEVEVPPQAHLVPDPDMENPDKPGEFLAFIATEGIPPESIKFLDKYVRP